MKNNGSLNPITFFSHIARTARNIDFFILLFEAGDEASLYMALFQDASDKQADLSIFHCETAFLPSLHSGEPL